MSSGGGKKNKSYTSGYRYYFSVLAGICRGPVDEIFLIKSDGRMMFDGSYRAPLYYKDRDFYDPAKPFGYDDIAAAGRLSGNITNNETLVINQPNLYGGEKSEGGIDGLLSVYFGAKDQIISAADYIKYVMTQVAGVMLSDMRGVVTAFFDGEVCANNPYPKAWSYRVRRVLKGWDGTVWYPQRAVIKLTDPGLAAYQRGVADTSTTTSTTVIYGADGTSLVGGESTGSGSVVSVTSSYSGAAVTTYSATTGAVSNYNVPLEYNDIYAMNPAHIIYECATNRDWGSGKDRALLDNVSFTDAANRLYDEGFGLCMKWSRTEEVDVFVQTVLDHIGGVVYTDKLTGLLCLRLVRGGYTVSALPHFDYNSGLLEVTSADTPSNDVVASEVIVKYRSPVLDADKEARAQNIASMDSLGCIYSTTRDYSGLPTSTLALQVAQRDLKIFSGGWKKVEATLDRRAYSLNPGDVIVLNAPDRHLSNFVMRVATVAESTITEGVITVTGAADIFGLPITPMVVTQKNEFLDVNRYPVPILIQNAAEATFRDMYAINGNSIQNIDIMGPRLTFLAAKPSPSSMNYRVQTWVAHYGSTEGIGNWRDVATNTFARLSTLKAKIGTMDTVIAVTGDLLPGRVTIGSALTICSAYETAFSQEFCRLDGISRDAITGTVYLTVARGCLDTPAIPHDKGSRVWAYDDTGIADPTEYTKYDLVGIQGFNHTALGDATTAHPVYQSLNWRSKCPYSGADFRVNSYPRDATPALTGTLDFTWKHRDRLKIEDQLVGETEEGGVGEPNAWYSVYIQGTSSTTGRQKLITTFITATLGPTSITGNHVSITQAALEAAGIGDGPMQVYLVTARTSGVGGSTYADVYSYRWPKATFFYGVEPDTSGVGDGFNFDFDQAFDGVSA